MSRDILTKFRTKVIEDFIMIEGYVNTIISKHYLGIVSKNFFWEVLQDELFNFGLRANILEKIFQSMSYFEKPKQLTDFISDLRRLSKIRNYFAHSNTSYFEGPPEAKKGGVLHPKKAGEFLDFDILYKEFEGKVQKVSEQLMQIMDKMGVFYMYDTDKKNMTIFPEQNLKKGISIKILYYAEQTGINQLYDLDGIDEFRSVLSGEYLSVVQGKPGDLGGLEKFLIDMIANISLESFVKFILGGIAFDLIKSGTESLVLRPFINAYKKLKSKNAERLDIERFSIIFEDTTIHIYQIYHNSVIEQLETILNTVASHYSSLITSEGEKPSEIHIAVFQDKSVDRLSPYRVKLDVDETIPHFSEKDYVAYWGIFYEYSHKWIVYDLKARQLLNEEFLTLQQYWQRWELKRR